MRSLWILAFTLSALACAHADEASVIEIESGRISGTVADGVRSYKGIPFAASTAGPARWKQPTPPEHWTGVRACTEFGPECPQLPYPKESMFYNPPRLQSEDCLNLNVWTAAKSPGEKLPVMVWIHGGALTRGSGATPTYDGANFARRGVVLVTINYRLGVFGFLAHRELTAESEHKSSGNYGALDQIAALKWVKRNIAAFGGDPGRVTIFGESAGSFSVNTLAASPLAAGLFHRAIGQSGGSFGPMARLGAEVEGIPSAEEMGTGFLKAAGAAAIAELREQTTEQILDAFKKVGDTGGSFRSTFNVDGWVLPAEIREVFATGRHNDVPTMVGSNAKEMTTLLPPAMAPKTIDAYRAALKMQAKDHAVAMEAIYPAQTDAEAADAFFAFAGDRAFGVQMRAWARAAAKGKSKAYLYHFTRVPPLPNKEYLGAFHAAEISYVFGNLRPSFEENDRKLSDAMATYWTNFAKTGDPNGPGLPEWPAYDPATESCMILGDKVESANKLNKARLDAIEQAFQLKR